MSPFPKVRFSGHGSPLSFPVRHLCQHTPALCPVLPSFFGSLEGLTSADTSCGSSGERSAGGLQYIQLLTCFHEWEGLFILRTPLHVFVYQIFPSATFFNQDILDNYRLTEHSCSFFFFSSKCPTSICSWTLPSATLSPLLMTCEQMMLHLNKSSSQ